MKADHKSVERKLKIARGQIDGILQMIEDDRYCVDISNQLLATQALLKRANQQIVQAHIQNCVREALEDALEEALEEDRAQLANTPAGVEGTSPAPAQSKETAQLDGACVSDNPNPKLEEALQLLERMAQ